MLNDAGTVVRERDVEDHLRKQVRALGGWIYKVKFIQYRGAPDDYLWVPWMRTPVWAEVKKPGEKPEPHQAEVHATMRKGGATVFVVDSCEAVDKMLGLR